MSNTFSPRLELTVAEAIEGLVYYTRLFEVALFLGKIPVPTFLERERAMTRLYNPDRPVSFEHLEFIRMHSWLALAFVLASNCVQYVNEKPLVRTAPAPRSRGRRRNLSGGGGDEDIKDHDAVGTLNQTGLIYDTPLFEPLSSTIHPTTRHALLQAIDCEDTGRDTTARQFHYLMKCATVFLRGSEDGAAQASHGTTLALAAARVFTLYFPVQFRLMAGAPKPSLSGYTNGDGSAHVIGGLLPLYLAEKQALPLYSSSDLLSDNAYETILKSGHPNARPLVLSETLLIAVAPNALLLEGTAMQFPCLGTINFSHGILSLGWQQQQQQQEDPRSRAAFEDTLDEYRTLKNAVEALKEASFFGEASSASLTLDRQEVLKTLQTIASHGSGKTPRLGLWTTLQHGKYDDKHWEDLVTEKGVYEYAQSDFYNLFIGMWTAISLYDDTHGRAHVQPRLLQSEVACGSYTEAGLPLNQLVLGHFETRDVMPPIPADQQELLLDVLSMEAVGAPYRPPSTTAAKPAHPHAQSITNYRESSFAAYLGENTRRSLAETASKKLKRSDHYSLYLFCALPFSDNEVAPTARLALQTLEKVMSPAERDEVLTRYGFVGLRGVYEISVTDDLKMMCAELLYRKHDYHISRLASSAAREQNSTGNTTRKTTRRGNP